MTREQALWHLRELADSTDPEMAGVDADTIIAAVLVRLGYADVVDAWDKVPRWYA